jgi:tRNA-2-methylthio-N6-dimethylallyladenosine synthase
MNVHDSGRMAQVLTGLGLEEAGSPADADLLIVNSCSVRAKPEHKALSEAGKYQAVKKARNARIVLAGCVAQQEGERLIQDAGFLDAVMGPDAIVRLPRLLQRLEQGESGLVDIAEHDEENPCFVPLGTDSSGRRISAPVTIMKGCNNYCSYCVVPFVRGREVSRPLADILAELECLADRGCREVILLGQNVNSYRDPKGVDFSGLLEAVQHQGRMARIRFTTSHPKDVSTRLVQAMANLDRVCEHLHLALQSGSDRVLERMNRGYTRDDFVARAAEFRNLVPGVSITTDLIVGFPGETEEDFQATLDTVRTVAFDQAFSFKYSVRPGTAAARFQDDVEEAVKARRLLELQELLGRLEADSLARLTSTTQEILVEGTSLRDPQAGTGRTRCNRVVNYQAAGPVTPGELIRVRVTEVRGHTLWGEGLTNRRSNQVG